MRVRHHILPVLILCALALPSACGESPSAGVPAVNLASGKTDRFDPGQLPQGWAACLDAACERLASQIPCQNLGPALCGQRPECRQRLLWCDPIAPPTCGDTCADTSVVECTYACMPVDSLVCEEIAAQPACTGRPDCQWREAYCPDNCGPEDQSCAGCRPAGCFASKPPPCATLDPSSCSYRTDCQWTPTACPGCEDPGECPCEPYCRPVEDCPPVRLPPADYCNPGQIIPQYSSTGCLLEFTCVQGCPPVPDPPPCAAEELAREIRDLGGCVVGYACPVRLGNVLPSDEGVTAVASPCVDLQRQYDELLPAAKSCAPAGDGDGGCTDTLPSAIVCGCPTALNAGANTQIERLEDILRQWTNADCAREIRCAARACVAPKGGRCEPTSDGSASGTCQDQFE